MKDDTDRNSTPVLLFHHHHQYLLKNTKLFFLFNYFQPFLIFLTLFLLHLPSSSAASINGLNKDFHLLLSFKTSLPNSSFLQDWMPTKRPCNFTGVSCKNSRVSSVDLSNYPLSIDFSLVASSLMSIQNLESLVLKNANLSGGLVSVRRSQCGLFLYSIDLSGNFISGPVSDVFSFGVCSRMGFVNLSMNSMDSFVKEEDRVVSTSRIQVLDLSYNNISGVNVLSLLLSNQFPELQLLSLKGNKLAGDVPPLDFKNLNFLDLSMNNLSTMFPSVHDCSNLQHLDLSSNKFFGDVGTNLSSCGKLNLVNLTSNLLTGPLPKLPSGGNMQFVYLKGNKFQGVLPSYLSDLCSSLVELDLSLNSLSGTIPDSFGTCSGLELLDISSSNLSGEMPIGVLANMTSLKSLVLSFNGFYGSFPESLFKFSTNLETLDLSSNNISGVIPSGICQDSMKNLQVLYLQNNMLTGQIPEGLSNCSQLVSLDLSFNYLTGTIPSSLGSLSKIRDLIMMLNLLQGEIPQELMYLQSLENLILDFNYLNGSIPASISNCTYLNWISLSNNQLTGEIPPSLGQLQNLAILKLGNNSISGSIPGELGDCRSLLWVDINTNLLNGNIPPTLFKQSGNMAVALLTGKSYIYVKNDGSKQCHGAGNLLEFGGIREVQLDRLTTRQPCNFTRVYRGKIQPTFNHNGSMIFLDLSYNRLEGSIPKELGASYYLQILNLGHNDLSGPIPQELGGLKNAAILDLSYNRLNGSIPQSLTSLTFLGEADMSNNNLSGMIPQSAPFDTFPEYRFFNNSGLCGYPLPSCGTNSGGDAKQHRISHQRVASLAGNVAIGLLFALFCIVGLVIALIETKKRRKKKEAALEAYIESHSNGVTAANSNWKLSAHDLSINVATFDKPLRKLTFADLLEATNNFHNDSLIGSGGFGDVYKARLKDGSVVAIKKLIHISGQGDREFTAEMETIGKIKHRNLVPLLGYCKVGEERLLVYEYMKYGSLENVLREKHKLGIKLNWAARRKIAIGAARGLAFLHHNCIPHIIHRDMKSSNVLVDENLEARVSDFGMARLVNAMDTHLSVSTLAGTPGYVPPEYYQSFRCSTKGDVYSYGVVLLELLTGKQPTDSSDFGDNNIVGWVKQHDKLRITDVFDPELLKDDPSSKIELLQHLRIACSCLDDRPWKRPTMIQVMAMFKEIQVGSGIESGSTIAAEEGGKFSPVEGVVEMTIKEGNEASKHL